jgi:predicted Zn-dependent protease
VTLGRVLLGKGSTKEAIAELQEGERVAPNAARTHYYLQQAYQRAGRVADAQREKLTFNKLRAEQEPVTVTNQENTK